MTIKRKITVNQYIDLIKERNPEYSSAKIKRVSFVYKKSIYSIDQYLNYKKGNFKILRNRISKDEYKNPEDIEHIPEFIRNAIADFATNKFDYSTASLCSENRIEQLKSTSNLDAIELMNQLSDGASGDKDIE